MIVPRERGGVAYGTAVALLDVHALDKAIRNPIDVPELDVRHDVSAQVLHELMNLDIDGTRLAFDNCEYVHARNELSPLTRPILSDFLFPDNATTLRRLGPVKSGVRL
jgi:hypothetical protein